MTRKKKWALTAVGLFLVLAVAAGAALWALWQVPEFYAEATAAVPRDPVQRQQAAKELVQETTNLVNNIRHSDRWTAEFHQDQINSWMVEELRQPKYAELIPEGVSDPRICVEPNVIQVGFRMQYKAWNGIASVRVRPWVTEDGRLALEVESVRAGLVPVPLEDTLHELSRELEEAGYHVTWQQSNGNDVAIVDFVHGMKHPLRLDAIEVTEGLIRVAGSEPSQVPNSDNLSTRRMATKSNQADHPH